ncbi:unnamed protein product [Allacma fusca]|uniref:Uncharacterized protein n=1 Tax=Allacma fusca TaxID=39272 RepID=A0A8J2K6W7_9HEXA|nr:unnamed protein product [Allacma fusca]
MEKHFWTGFLNGLPILLIICPQDRKENGMKRFMTNDINISNILSTNLEAEIFLELRKSGRYRNTTSARFQRKVGPTIF